MVPSVLLAAIPAMCAPSPSPTIVIMFAEYVKLLRIKLMNSEIILPASGEFERPTLYIDEPRLQSTATTFTSIVPRIAESKQNYTILINKIKFYVGRLHENSIWT